MWRPERKQSDNPCPSQAERHISAGATYRIRLSDKDSCVRPQDVEIRQTKLDQAKLLVQVFVRVA
jgi:hypothetical protein